MHEDELIQDIKATLDRIEQKLGINHEETEENNNEQHVVKTTAQH